MHVDDVVAWHRWTPESKVHQIMEEMSIGQTPNHAKFCGDVTKSVRDIHDRKFVLWNKWDKIHQNCLRPATP